MSGGHMLEAFVAFLHGTIHQRGVRGSVGSSDDGGHVWMRYYTPEGRIHELHVLAIQEEGAPRLVARHFVADSSTEVAQQAAAWLRGYRRS